jgi:hypothetical protein
MSGWPLPPTNRDIPGDGPFVSDNDAYDFSAGSKIPKHMLYWRVPREGAVSTTAKGLQIVPSRNNMTGTPRSTTTPELSGRQGLSFIARRQTHTLFTYSVDLTFSPKSPNQEAGVSVFLTQLNHLDLGVVLLPGPAACSPPVLSLRFRGIGTGTAPPEKIVPVPAGWAEAGPIRLQIQTANATHYNLSAMPAGDPKKKILVGTGYAGLLSGGDGSFVGSLVGAYATCNGAGTGVVCPAGGEGYFNRWRYTGAAQFVAEGESVPQVVDMRKSEV